jgi:hypothetical protein
MLQAVKNRISAKPKITREQLLGARPLRHPRIEWAREPRKGDSTPVALLKIPRLRGRWPDLVAKWLKVPDHKKVELDEIGSDVWQMCDGTHTVDAIAKAVASSYRLNRRQAEVSVTAYLKMLAERQLLALKTAKAPATAGSAKSAGTKTARKRAA